MLCKRCGSTILEDDSFCPACGTPVAQQEPAPEPRKYEAPKKKKKHIGLTIAAIITALGLVAGGLVAAWFLLRNPQTQEPMYLLSRIGAFTEDGLQYSVVEYEYDDRGRLICLRSESAAEKVDGEMVYSEITGQFDSVTEYSYDANGYLTGVATRSQDRGSSLLTEYEIEDNQITKIRRVKTAADGKETEELYLVEYEGDKISEVSQNTKNGFEPYYQVAYDKEGRIVEEINHASRAKYEFDYDDDGRLQRVKQYGQDYSGKGWSDWILRFRADYEYDNKGNLLRVEKTDTDGNDDGMELSYNKENQLISTVLYADGERKEVFNYKYDSGRVVSASHTEYDDEGNPTNLKLIFDKNGNLEEYYDKTGGYTKYDYKKVTLSAADAEAVRRYNECNERSGISNDLYGKSYDHYTPFFAWYLIPTPLDPAYGTGPLHR